MAPGPEGMMSTKVDKSRYFRQLAKPDKTWVFLQAPPKRFNITWVVARFCPGKVRQEALLNWISTNLYEDRADIGHFPNSTRSVLTPELKGYGKKRRFGQKSRYGANLYRFSKCNGEKTPILFHIPEQTTTKISF